MDCTGHMPVLADEVVRLLVVDPSGIYMDCTCGLGGHAGFILQQLSGHPGDGYPDQA
jgi:16S rRNA (cytosine1402-N4)-methyltransferase